MRPAAAIPSAISMSRSCSPPASTSTRRSTSSISKASTTSSRRSPGSACARPCRIPFIDRADDIEVIDLTPDDLIQRLKEGKVYVPETAQRALEHYFSPGNLTALRELALRRTAQRVDEQLLTHMQAHAIPGPGRPASASWCGQRTSQGCGARALCAPPRRAAARTVGGALRRDPARAAAHRGRARPHRRRAAARGDARRRGRDHSGRRTARAATSSATPRPTISPTSSSASPSAPGCTKCSSARSRPSSCARPATSAVHVIAGERAGDACTESGCSNAHDRKAFDFSPIWRARPSSPSPLPSALAAPAVARRPERRAGLPDRRAGERGHLRALARSLRHRSSACSPTTSSSCRRSTPSRSPIRKTSSRCSSSCWSRSSPAISRRACAARRWPRAARQDDRGPLSVQPQAGRHRLARRPALGDGLPDRLDAEGARGAAPARRTARSRCGPAIRRRTCSTKPTSPPRNGPGRATGRPGVARTRCRARSGCSCRCGPARGAGRRRRHRQRQAGAAPDARPAPPARCAHRPGRACHRAGQAGGGCRPGEARGRDGSAALRAAHLHLARPATPLASILGAASSLKSYPARFSTTRRGRSSRRRSRRRRSGSTGSSPTCST